MTYLGIGIDYIHLQVRLQDDKHSKLIHMIELWSNKECTKRELLSKVVKLRRVFLHRLIITSTYVAELQPVFGFTGENRY